MKYRQNKVQASSSGIDCFIMLHKDIHPNYCRIWHRNFSGVSFLFHSSNGSCLPTDTAADRQMALFLEGTVASSAMETSNFAHVIFQNVGKSYLPHAALECHYTLTQFIKPNPKDWVGIFKVTLAFISLLFLPCFSAMFCTVLGYEVSTKRSIDKRL